MVTSFAQNPLFSCQEGVILLSRGVSSGRRPVTVAGLFTMPKDRSIFLISLTIKREHLVFTRHKGVSNYTPPFF